MVVAGTRPEVIKLAPVIRALRKSPASFETIYCSTGQHREMLAQANRVFQLDPDIDLGLMVQGQSLSSLTGVLFRALGEVLERTRPDAVVVQGDTTSAFVGAMCGFYQKLQVGHVEAGLRTGDIYSPFPEEINRTLLSRLATDHFAPTTRARDTLLREGIAPERVHMTGNTIVDALQWARANVVEDPTNEVPAQVIESIATHRLLLVTSHRRESFGEGLRHTCSALMRLERDFEDTVIVYPVHLNPEVQLLVRTSLANHPRIHLLPPVTYSTLLWLMSKAFLILTDSGGIQEEAPSLNTPLLVLRESTERPEVVEAGCAMLVGTDPDRIVNAASRLLADPATYTAMRGKANPFGDGRAGERIVRVLAGETPDT